MKSLLLVTTLLLNMSLSYAADEQGAKEKMSDQEATEEVQGETAGTWSGEVHGSPKGCYNVLGSKDGCLGENDHGLAPVYSIWGEGDWIPYGPQQKAYKALLSSTLSLKEYLATDSYLSLQLENGDWVESSSLMESLRDGSIIATSAVILYKIFKSVNLTAIGLSVGSAGAYADFDSEIRDYPERIFEKEKSQISWMIKDKEIGENTLKMLEYSYNHLCIGSASDIAFCAEANALFIK